MRGNPFINASSGTQGHENFRANNFLNSLHVNAKWQSASRSKPLRSEHSNSFLNARSRLLFDLCGCFGEITRDRSWPNLGVQIKSASFRETNCQQIADDAAIGLVSWSELIVQVIGKSNVERNVCISIVYRAASEGVAKSIYQFRKRLNRFLGSIFNTLVFETNRGETFKKTVMNDPRGVAVHRTRFRCVQMLPENNLQLDGSRTGMTEINDSKIQRFSIVYFSVDAIQRIL